MKVVKLLLCLLVSSVCFSAVVVSNVSMRQIPGTKTVEINYDVSSDSSDTVDVSLEVKDGDTILPATTLTGDIGAGVATGTGKTITWNAGTDWNGNVATLDYTVEVYDGVGMAPGGDPSATNWEVINGRWVKNTYANGDITMSDRTTGKMWLYNANPCGTTSWSGMIAYCDNLVFAGHSDWVLPDKYMLAGQYGQKEFFINVQGGWYFSSTLACCDQAWGVSMLNGTVACYGPKDNYRNYVWPMRLAGKGHADIGSGSATTLTDTRDYALTVSSARGGNPVPGIGTHASYCWQSTVTPSVDAVAGNYTCSGWSGTGSIPASGAANTTGEILLNELASTITWLWEEDIQYHTITLRLGEHGSIAEANSGVDYVTQVADGAAFPTVTVVPNTGYTFTGWQSALPDTVTADFEATAQYELITYTVTFNPGNDCYIVNGGAAAVQSVPYGGAAITPDMDTYDGFYFMGWDADFSNITADLTINAISRERFNGKDGIEEPLEILITDELVYISENNEYWNLGVVLKGDIDCTTARINPIGNIDTPFTGIFNGCGYWLNGLEFTSDMSPFLALFGVIGENGIVKNLGVDANVVAMRHINFDTSIIAGKNEGFISCCAAKGVVNGYITSGAITSFNTGTIENCYSLADCTAYFAGGLVGENIGIIANSYSTSLVTSFDNGIAINNTVIDATTKMPLLNTLPWDTINNNDDGLMDIWYQNNEQLPMLYWQTTKGDCNNDGIIDDSDFQIIAFSWLSENSESERQLGDINLDGIVDLEDLALLSQNW